MEKKRIDPALWLKDWQIAQREARRAIRRARGRLSARPSAERTRAGRLEAHEHRG